MTEAENIDIRKLITSCDAVIADGRSGRISLNAFVMGYTRIQDVLQLALALKPRLEAELAAPTSIEGILKRHRERQQAYDYAKEASGEPLSACGPSYHQDIGKLLSHIAALTARPGLTEEEAAAVKLAENFVLSEDVDELEEDDLPKICWALIKLSDRLTAAPAPTLQADTTAECLEVSDRWFEKACKVSGATDAADLLSKIRAWSVVAPSVGVDATAPGGVPTRAQLSYLLEVLAKEGVSNDGGDFMRGKIADAILALLSARPSAPTRMATTERQKQAGEMADEIIAGEPTYYGDPRMHALAKEYLDLFPSPQELPAEPHQNTIRPGWLADDLRAAGVRVASFKRASQPQKEDR